MSGLPPWSVVGDNIKNAIQKILGKKFQKKSCIFLYIVL